MLKTWIMALMLLIGTAGQLAAHCQVPCGIFDDPTRVKLMYEDIATIGRCIEQINVLSAAPEKNYNQLVRWITTKDEHSEKLQELITNYFLAQRIKPRQPQEPGYDKYIYQLTLLHQLQIKAVKAKQSSSPELVKEMKVLLKQFEDSYFAGINMETAK